MEKRVILFILLSFSVFLGFQYLGPKRKVSRIETRQEEKTETAALIQEKSNVETKALIPASKSIDSSKATDTKASAQKIVISGDKYLAVLDNKGGVLTSWELNKYKTSNKQDFEMISGNNNGDRELFPGAMIFGEKALEGLANNEFYQISIENGNIINNKVSAPATILLQLNKDDLKIEKRYSFEKENYLVNLKVNVTKAGKPVDGRFFLGQDMGPLEEHISSSAKLEAVFNTGGKIKRESPPKDPQELKRIEGDLRWVGLDMQYFSMIVIPRQPIAYFNIQKRSIKQKGMDGTNVERDLLSVSTPISGSFDYQLYIGPKNQESLKAVASADISGVINYGMFSIIIYPLLTSLRWIHQYVHNYGFSIVLLTLIISLLLFPFRFKQMISMKRMQVVQPKIKALQDKYKKFKGDANKRSEMNTEMMALYKEHNVNPLGGCLPLILQMPLLFAFYSLLAYSIELRQAPFIFWIHDLSAKDPFYVLPIVMGLTSFISQKMTPMAPSTDPTQAKMMMIMPLVFTFMFLQFSSGLNLYYLCSNVFQIILQIVTQKMIKDGKAESPLKVKK
jgi:YidC/Oxa1 family membrane protein insertase